MSAGDSYLRSSSIIERVQINNEKFIQEVYKRRSLWDQKSVDYLNRSLKAKEWESVALEMNCTVDDVKNRWKLLKDSFNREVRNMTKNCSSSSKWAHFEQMSFLLKGNGGNNFLLPSACLSQSMTEPDYSIGHNAPSSYENELSENSLTMPEEDNEYQPPPKKKAKYHMRPSSSSAFSPTAPQQVDCSAFIKPDPSNEDYFFLMSLLPTFERMSAKQKMLVKIKMMQDVYEAAFKGSVSSSSMSSEAQNSYDPVSSGS